MVPRRAKQPLFGQLGVVDADVRWNGGCLDSDFSLELLNLD
jgi:hypothetical protein